MRGILNEAFLSLNGVIVKKKKRSESLAREGIGVLWIAVLNERKPKF